MTLKNYIDNINLRANKLGLLVNPYPFAYMKQLVNRQRQWIANETKCLECWNDAEVESGKADYEKPSDCIYILDVWYVPADDDTDKGYPLTRKNNRAMNMWRERGEPSGTPTHWADYGGDNQQSGFLYLYPTPDVTGDVIRLHTIQLPKLLEEEDSVCELSPILQPMVEEGAVLELESQADVKTDTRFPYRYSMFLRKVNSAKTTRVL